MYTYKQVCSMITSRLIKQLEISEPYFLRDDFIRESRRKGSNLWESELEVMWLNMIADCFDDNVLRALSETRNQMYAAYEQYGHQQITIT